MDAELEHLRRKARPDDLASLRRLDAALQRTGWRVEGKTIREWIADFVLAAPGSYPTPDPAEMVLKAGLAAVPALVDTLRTKQLAAKNKLETRIRTHCVDVLARMEPTPTCAVPALLETLNVPSAQLRQMTLYVLSLFHVYPTALAVRALLTCLGSKHELGVRIQAARTLSFLEGALPEEVRRAALSRLTDSDKRVRRYSLRILARFPAPDPEICTALEEQIILDDANRIEALRALVEFDTPRAFELLREELLRLSSRHDERSLSECARVLQLIGSLGARAEPLLPVLRGLSVSSSLAFILEAAVDGILRDQLFTQTRTHGAEPLQDERAVRLLQDVVPQDPSEPLERALTRWAAGFIPYGHELCVRMALAAARRVVGLWDSSYALNDGPREALFALEDWVLDPSEVSARRAVNRGDLVPSQLSAPDEFSASWSVTFATLCAPTEEQRAEWAAHAQPLGSAEGGFLGSAVLSACRALRSASVITFAVGSREEPSRLTMVDAVREVRQAIVAELLPWIRGTWDPVLDVARRRRELLARPVASTGRYPP
ncbi:hypothetical protein [Hyalangium rubrum]|uniref:HEAT repeat domain-containing protein n=1 Tax=Hyalangium rubrum TaxID=3103134 RepID=A0ABU5H1V9_9BACT|nr:hypothetical protein [Hyalangium sp. s54d21]MDY7226767.1 hypothetical protein [Hyalangium sp. s54d21]